MERQRQRGVEKARVRGRKGKTGEAERAKS